MTDVKKRNFLGDDYWMMVMVTVVVVVRRFGGDSDSFHHPYDFRHFCHYWYDHDDDFSSFVVTDVRVSCSPSHLQPPYDVDVPVCSGFRKISLLYIPVYIIYVVSEKI